MSNAQSICLIALLVNLGCTGHESSEATTPSPAEARSATPPPEEELKQVDVRRGADCKRAGCSKELCVDASAGYVATPCLWRPHYGCYDDAECTRQADGQCGWTQSEALLECIRAASSSN